MRYAHYIVLILALLAPAARAQFGTGFPPVAGLRIQDEGTTLAARPFLNCTGAGIACSIGSSTQYSLTVAAGAGGTLQNAYDNGTGTINFSAGSGAINLRDTAGGIGGNLLAVQSNAGGTTYLGVSSTTTTIVGGITQTTGAVSLTGNAASSFTTSAGALTLTGVTASTWSTTTGNLTITGGAALALNTTGANSMTITSTQTANVAGAVTFNTTNLYTNGQPYVFKTGGNRIMSILSNGADSYLQGFNSATDAATSSLDLHAANIVLGFGPGGSLNPATDNVSAIGTSVLRWTTGFLYTADLRTGIAYGTNAGANATVTATAAAANTDGVTWTHTGGAAGAGSGSPGGVGGKIQHTAGTGGAAGTAAGVGGAMQNTGGTGGAASATVAGAIGGAATYTGGTGGAGSAGAAAGAGAATTIAGGAAGANGGGGGAAGGALNLNGGAGSGAGANGVVTLGQATTASISLGVNSSMASQTTFNLGTYTTAQLPGTCTDGAIVWDSTTTTVKRCKSNAWASLAAGSSEWLFSSYNSANLSGGTAFSQMVVTNAATIADGNQTYDIAGVGGGNFVAKLCSDGATCAVGNTYVTCTKACGDAAGSTSACTINTSAVPASTTLTLSVATACATTDPGVNVVIHFTNP